MVALGEATHGTREFFQMKHRVFQYLVEHLNHKAFGFEADFAESIYLNNYVTRGEGDLEELMKTKMHFWTWRTEEVKELLEWMKNYNTGKSDEEKIHYLGFDCQYLTYQPDLIQIYLQPLLPILWETASPILEQIQDLSRDDYGGMSEEDYKTLKAQLESLEDQLTANKDQLVANSSLKEYEISKQLFRTFRQAFIVLYDYYGNGNDSTNWRDRFMAENALWIADFFGEDTRITLWAHNGHIARNNQYQGDGAMGYHLHEHLGDLYQAVGFGFSKGSFTAGGQESAAGNWTHQITDEPSSASVNFLFHHASHSNFAFNLDAIPPGSAWDSWLSESRPFLSIGALYNGSPGNYYRSTNLRQHYNWIIYFDTTNASILIPR
jgi:erythromycin esterase